MAEEQLSTVISAWAHLADSFLCIRASAWTGQDDKSSLLSSFQERLQASKIEYQSRDRNTISGLASYRSIDSAHIDEQTDFSKVDCKVLGFRHLVFQIASCFSRISSAVKVKFSKGPSSISRKKRGDGRWVIGRCEAIGAVAKQVSEEIPLNVFSPKRFS